VCLSGHPAQSIEKTSVIYIPFHRQEKKKKEKKKKQEVGTVL
jgi:hypothetical protein